MASLSEGRHLILDAVIHHRRLVKRDNYFSYRLFYFCLFMNQLKLIKTSFLFGINRYRLFSYFDKDHGNRNNKSALDWAESIFKKNHLEVDNIYLITMPRVMGYLFNPISFWLGFSENKLIGVINEVNNTFNQTHSYLCRSLNGDEINKTKWFKSQKALYVSPFFDRDGYYQFNFDVDIKKTKNINILIHYYKDDKKVFVTALKGQFKPLDKKNLFSYFFKNPLLTFKVTFLIHYQAVKLFLKGVKCIKRPNQKEYKLSICHEIK